MVCGGGPRATASRSSTTSSAREGLRAVSSRDRRLVEPRRDSAAHLDPDVPAVTSSSTTRWTRSGTSSDQGLGSRSWASMGPSARCQTRGSGALPTRPGRARSGVLPPFVLARRWRVRITRGPWPTARHFVQSNPNQGCGPVRPLLQRSVTRRWTASRRRVGDGRLSTVASGGMKSDDRCLSLALFSFLVANAFAQGQAPAQPSLRRSRHRLKPPSRQLMQERKRGD